MKLFLCPIAHKGDYSYCIKDPCVKKDDVSGKSFLCPEKMIDVTDCQIRSSIFSPLSIDVLIRCSDGSGASHNVFYNDNNLNSVNYTDNFIPYYSTYGLAMFDDEQLKWYGMKKNDAFYDKNREALFNIERMHLRLGRGITQFPNRNYKTFSNFKRLVKSKLKFYIRNVNPLDEQEEYYFENLELPYCVLSNRPNDFVPFVVVRTCFTSAEKEVMIVTLVEKRALALSLCHKFECFSPKDTVSEDECNNKNMAKGLLSVPEIIERLSIIPEDEDKVLGDTSVKNIVNFASAGSNRDKGLGPTNPKEQVEHCAFLSRFIAPASQSRLSIIYSLARKYGYGLVYRPRSHQYYAVDLLRYTAPGWPTNKDTPYDFEDCYTFDDEDDNYYYGQYSHNKQNNFSRLKPGLEKNPYPLRNFDKYNNSDFSDFFLSRLYPKVTSQGFGSVGLEESFPYDYKYSSRCTALASTVNYPSSNPMNKSGFNLTAFLPVCQSDLDEIKEINNSDKENIYSLYLQSSRWTYRQGADNIYFEDQVSLDKYNLYDPMQAFAFNFNTPNQRLNFARYRLKNMKNSIIEFVLAYYDKDTKPNHTSNLIYEIFNRLSYATDLFMYASTQTAPEVVFRHGKKTSSGATYSIIEDNITDREGNYGLQNLLNGPWGYQHNPFDQTGSIFGRIFIDIRNIDYNSDPQAPKLSDKYSYASTEYMASPEDAKKEDLSVNHRIVGQRYSINSNMLFYNIIGHQNFDYSQENQQDNINSGQVADSRPKELQMPTTSSKPRIMSKIYRTNSNAVEFDYGSNHYSYSDEVMQRLCDYILKASVYYKFAGDDDGQLFRLIRDRRLVVEYQDPLPVIKTYIAYKRLRDFRSDWEEINTYLQLQNQWQPFLQNAELKQSYMRGPISEFGRPVGLTEAEKDDYGDDDGVEPGYQPYKYALIQSNRAKSELERLSKKPSGTFLGLVKNSNGLWQVEQLDSKGTELFKNYLYCAKNPETLTEATVRSGLEELKEEEERNAQQERERINYPVPPDEIIGKNGEKIPIMNKGFLDKNNWPREQTEEDRFWIDYFDQHPEEL